MSFNCSRLVLVEGEAQASLHRPAAVGASVDAAAQPFPLGSVQAGVAAGYPAPQVAGQCGPVKVPGDLSLADSLAVVAVVVMKLLQDGIYLGAGVKIPLTLYQSKRKSTLDSELQGQSESSAP